MSVKLASALVDMNLLGELLGEFALQSHILSTMSTMS